MRKLILLSLFALTSVFAFSQSNLVRAAFSAPIAIDGGTAIQVGFGADYERAIGDRGSIGAGFHYWIGDLDAPYINIDGKYYFNESINGFYLGGFYGIALPSGGTMFSVGPTVGYHVPVADNFRLDIGTNFGVNITRVDFGFGTASSTGLIFNPRVGFGYAF